MRSERLDVLPWIFGRFYVVRQLYRIQRKALSHSPSIPSRVTIFPTVNVKEAAEAIRKEAVFTRVRIPDDYVQQLRRFAMTQTLTMRHGPAGFQYDDVKNGRLSDG